MNDFSIGDYVRISLFKRRLRLLYLIIDIDASENAPTLYRVYHPGGLHSNKEDLWMYGSELEKFEK